MTVPIGLHSDGSNDWMSEFLKKEQAKQKKRVVEADYLSRLKQHVEEQKNAGKYINVHSALEDFSRRLNLDAAERTALAEIVRYAGFDGKSAFDNTDEKHLKKEVEEQGAPASILPGVKPNQKTNKQKIDKGLAEDVAGQDVDGPEMPLTNASTSKKKSIVTAGAIDSNLYELAVDHEDVFVNFRVLRTGSNTVEISLKSNREASPQIKKVNNDNALRLTQTIIGLIEQKTSDPTIIQWVRSEAKGLANWLKKDLVPIQKDKSLPEMKEDEPEVKKPKAKEEEPEYHFSDDLDDVEVSNEDLEKNKKIEKEVREETEVKGEEPTGMSRLLALREKITIKQPQLEGSRGELLGAVTVDSTSLATNYNRAKTKYDQLEEKDELLRRMQKSFWSAGRVVGFALKYAKQGVTLKEALESTQEDLDNLRLEEDNEDAILATEARLAQLESHVRRFSQIAVKEGLSAEEQKDPNALLGLMSKYDEGRVRLEKQLSETSTRRDEAEAELLFYSNEHDRANLADHMKERLPQLIKERGEEDFDEYFSKLQEQGSKEQEEFLSNMREAFDTTQAPQAKFVDSLTGFLTPEFGSGKEFQSIYRSLKKHSGFLTVRPDDVQSVYAEQLKSKTPVVERRRNQVRKGSQEFVGSIAEPNKLFKGYLPTEELMKASSVLLFGVSEGQLLDQNRQKAIDYVDEQRRAAIRQIVEQKEHSLMSNLGRLHANAQDPDNEQARERYDALLEEAKKLVAPELRPYLIDPTEPIESVITEELLAQVIRRVVVPQKLADSGIPSTYVTASHADEDTGQLAFDTDILPVLEKVALKEGYALESYDVTIADHMNEVYMDQCSRFVGSLTRKRNAYDGMMNKHSYTGKTLAKKAVADFATERGLDTEWIASVERYLDLYDFYLLEEVRENYRPVSFGEKLTSDDLKKQLLGGSSSARYSKPATEKVLAKIDRDIEAAESDEQKAGLERAKEAFTKAVEARKKADANIVKAKSKSVQVDRLGEAANLVFSNVVQTKNFQVITPTSVSQLRITPDMLRKQIYSEAEYQGKQIDQFSANALLRKALKGFYQNAVESPDFSVDDLVHIFPTSKEEKESLREGLQQALSNGTQVAAELGAKGVVTGGDRPIFLFDSVPVSSGEAAGENYSVEQIDLGEVDLFITPFRLNVGIDSYECWAGTDDQILEQVDNYRMHRRFYSAHLAPLENPEKRADFLMEYSTDVEAVSKFSKELYKATGSTLSENLTLDKLGVSTEEARAIWENEVVSYLKDPSNPLGMKTLPGPPRSRWGKKGSANFILDGNAWKIGRKSAVYQQTMEWLESVTGADQEDKKKDKRARLLTRQVGRLENLMKRVVNYDPKKDATFPTAMELLGKKSFGKRRIAKIQRLLDIITGKEVSEEFSADEATNRLLKFVRNATSDLRHEKTTLINNGRGHAVLELTCPNPHANPTNSYSITYVVGQSRMGLFNSSSFDEIEEVFNWAEEAVDDPELAEEKKSVADRFKQDRFIVIGRKPTCPICGFQFHNVDEELSAHLQGDSGKTVIHEPAEYLIDLDIEAARSSYEYLIDKIRWLEMPENKEVTREESPIKYEEIEVLSIAQADENRPLKIRNPATNKLEIKQPTGGGYLPLIREILTSPAYEVEVDEEGNEKRIDNEWEAPSSGSSPVPYQHEWQAQLYDLLQRWKKDLIKTFGFKDVGSYAAQAAEHKWEYYHRDPEWKKTYERGLEDKNKQQYIYAPILEKVPEGITVGYQGQNYVAFNEDPEAQLAFYYDRDENNPDVIVPKGHDWHETSLNMMKRRADMVTTLSQIVDTGDATQLAAFMQDKKAEEVAQRLYPASVRMMPAGEQIQLMYEDTNVLLPLLEEPYTEEKLARLKLLLDETYGDFTGVAPEEWGIYNDGRYSLILQNRLETFDVNSKIESVVDRALSSADKPGGGIEAIQGDIVNLTQKYRSLTQALAQFQQDELTNAWTWLTNKIVRIKDDKRKEAKVALLSGEEKGQFETVKSMFELNQFPSVEEVRQKYHIGIDDEDDLRRVDLLLLVVNKMLKEFDSQHPANVSEAIRRQIGSRERLIVSFLDVVAKEVSTSEVTAKMENIRSEIENLVLWSDYGYNPTDPEEIQSDLSLIFGRYLPQTSVAKGVLKLVSEKLAKLNEQYIELQDVRKYLSSKAAVHASLQTRSDNSATPDPRFFYRVASVKPVGVHRTQGPKVNFDFTVGKEVNEEGEEIPLTRHLRSPNDIRTFVNEYGFEEAISNGSISSANMDVYTKLIERYVTARVRGYKFTSGSVAIELEPILSEKDRFYPARLGELTEAQKVSQVPESATRPVRYNLPMAIAKSYNLDQFDNVAALREAFEQQLVEIFDFASVAGDSASQSKTSRVDYSLFLRREARACKVRHLLSRLD